MATDSSGPKRRGLGRGLGALIMDTRNSPPLETEPTPADAATTVHDGVRQVAVEAIAPNPQQPRTHFDPAALEELAASIREHGILQPLIITENPQQAGSYWLIAGERRWRAARLAPLEQVPVIVRDASPQQLVEWALVENLQRADLNPLEEATAYHSLIEEFGLTQAEIGQRVGKSRSAIANTVRLLNLPGDVQSALVEGRITAGHARALLALSDQSAISYVLGRILARDLNVRQTEELVKQLAQPASVEVATRNAAEQEPDSQLSYLENRFRAVLSTRVNLTRNQDGSGRLTVHFYNDDDLDHLYRLIVGDQEP
jgi:ParB family chromosome partitioning protein